MYGLRSKLVCLFAQASVFVQAKTRKLTMKLVNFSVNYEFEMFYGTDPRHHVKTSNKRSSLFSSTEAEEEKVL